MTAHRRDAGGWWADPSAMTCARGCRRPRWHAPGCSDGDCGGCAARPAEHGVLCDGCHHRLRLMLTGHDGGPAGTDRHPDWPALPRGWGGAAWVLRWLDDHLDRARRTDSDRIRRTKGEPPIPLDVAVLEAAQQLRAVLTASADVIAERLRLSRVHDPVAVLARHLAAVEDSDWAVVVFTELADALSAAHALAPWRPPVRRCDGIACPQCQAPALVVYGGDDVVTCTACRSVIPAHRYELWTRMLLAEAGVA